MRSSRRSKLAAVTVFVLIALVVLGNLTWATVSSFELAKKTVMEEHERRLNLAVLELSSYMAGILNTETAREYTDYQAANIREPLAVYTRDGAELDTARVVLPSPLAVSGPPHDWIDLYFQLDPDDDPEESLSSPQIADDTSLWPVVNPHASPVARQTWEWLKTLLPGIDLHERVAGVCTSRSAPPTSVSGTVPPPTPRVVLPDTGAVSPTRLPVNQAYQRKKEKSFRDAQASYLPPAECVDAGIAERNVRNVTEFTAAGFDEFTEAPTDKVEIRADPITTFWLGTGPNGAEKLAFVRECHLDDTIFYQGFVGDWSRLKPELLREIDDRFPHADLEPIRRDSEQDSDVNKAEMFNLPVRLTVPEIPGGASAAAWRSVRGTLITTWIAAAAVLAVAGWGLRNLVALTERRMQFAYSVTHELRTPLTTFRLYSDMLAAGLVPDESKQEYLDTLNRESLRLSSLVEGVLEYARLENQKVKLSPTETDVASLLRVVSETLEKRCQENGIKAVTENAVPSGHRIRTDMDVVNRIAAVLVNNACRHARGNGDAAVVLRLAATDDQVHLDVIDSGPGIDRADARAIFKPFRRGRRADQAAQGGIGLGLALASNWAGLLGGRLELAARHDPEYGGAHFRLTIPTRLET